MFLSQAIRQGSNKRIYHKVDFQQLVHHSDRGNQHTSDDFQALLAAHGIECSMSGTGDCCDNSVVESWFRLLKWERGNLRRYRTREGVRVDAFDYSERLYNRQAPMGQPAG
jgi:putative transposase